MEVGAVKQAFNNEIILLKKNLNQARIQIIHKLTRKAKTLTEKKGPEKIKLKLKKKAESAVNEVLIIKKIKAKELAKFIVTHNNDLNKYLNKPEVDKEKACARLLLHKSLQDKYKIIRSRFSDIPIKDLFMSRQERRKLKKEAKEKQTNKKKGKDKSDILNIVNSNKIDNDDADDIKNYASSDDNKKSSDEEMSTDDENESSSNQNKIQESNNELESNVSESDKEVKEEPDNDNETVGRFVRLSPTENKKLLQSNVRPLIDETTNKNYVKPSTQQSIDKVKGSEKKLRENKNKNLKEKLLSRNFKKTSDVPVAETKVVDPFFITSTGESYMSVAEPRQPDEIKDIHKTGNRKERRAAMFGRKFEVKSKFSEKNKFSKNFSAKSNNKLNYNNSQIDFTNYKNDKSNFKDKNNRFSKSNGIDKDNDVKDKQEKLHPSWEAKKKQSSILPFQGKKIVFDEN